MVDEASVRKQHIEMEWLATLDMSKVNDYPGRQVTPHDDNACIAYRLDRRLQTPSNTA